MLRTFFTIFTLSVFQLISSGVHAADDIDNCPAQQQADKYTAVWKNLVMLRNNLTEDYFKRHFKHISTTVGCRNTPSNYDGKGRSVSVYYSVTTDWAYTMQADRFFIQTDRPADEEMKNPSQPYNLSVIQIKPHEHLAFASQAEAFAAFQHGNRVLPTTYPAEVMYYVERKTPPTDGDPYLLIKNRQGDAGGYMCGSINLVTGAGQSSPVADCQTIQNRSQPLDQGF